MADDIFSWIGDKLPTVYEAAIAIYKICKTPKGQKMKTTIHAYSVELRSMWVKAFGEKHVLAKSNIISKLEKIVADYGTKVYIEAKRKRPKVKSSKESKRARLLNANWETMDIAKSLWKVPGFVGKRNCDLLDIGKHMDELTGRESEFYVDQCSIRFGKLSTHVDDVKKRKKLKS